MSGLELFLFCGFLLITPVRTNLTNTVKNMTAWLQDTYLPKFHNLSLIVGQELDNMDGIQLGPVRGSPGPT